MSVSKLVTVWCNGCGTWEATGHDAVDARRAAKRMGWLVSLVAVDEMPEGDNPSLFRSGHRRDYCQECRRDRQLNSTTTQGGSDDRTE